MLPLLNLISTFKNYFKSVIHKSNLELGDKNKKFLKSYVSQIAARRMSRISLQNNWAPLNQVKMGDLVMTSNLMFTSHIFLA